MEKTYIARKDWRIKRNQWVRCFAVGESEMLLDDTLGVVKKLKKANIPVICDRKPDMFHSYVLYKNKAVCSGKT